MLAYQSTGTTTQQKCNTPCLAYQVKGIHQFANAHHALENAQAILVGGGNTFNLLNELYLQDLLGNIKSQINQGTPYVGWSAGSNICGNSIRTTNDMPILQPPSFEALNLVPFQLNPHYTDYQDPGHNGENWTISANLTLILQLNLKCSVYV